LIVYFDLSSGTSVVSSGPWNLTSCHDVPSSSLALLDFCPLANVRSELVMAAEAVATATNANINRIVFIFMTSRLSLKSQSTSSSADYTDAADSKHAKKLSRR
jgi:hypothetical protein